MWSETRVLTHRFGFFGIPVIAGLHPGRKKHHLANFTTGADGGRLEPENQSKSWREHEKYKAREEAASVPATAARLRGRRTPVPRSISPDLATRRPHEGGR